MGGSGGGIIIRQAAKDALSKPEIHGQLPAVRRAQIEAALKKDPADWHEVDCDAIGQVYHWALCNLK